MADRSTDGPGRRASDRRVFRAVSGTVGVILAAVLAVLLFIDAVARAGLVEALLLAPWMLAMVWAAYVLLYASHIAIDAEGLLVQNFLRRTEVRWRRIRDISLRWQVVFSLDDGTDVKSFGGPVAARPARPRLGASTAEAAHREPPAIRDLQLISEQWESAVSVPPAPGEVAVPVRHSWDLLGVVSGAVIVVWAIAAVIITSG